MKFSHSLVASALLAAPACAAPALKAPASAPPKTAKPAAKLVSITVTPAAIKLDGPRSEQGLIVTGTYADGSTKDLTAAATYQVSNVRVAAVKPDESRRVLRPLADGPATVTATVAGAPPVSAQVEVSDTGSLAPVSFRDEVVPALTKAGCSQGTCHGTPTGKGGFRLSLQGYAPENDFLSIVREGGGRRVNKADPGRSLILLKPMVQMPHAGGKRLSPEMAEFQVLSRWIAEGLHEDPADAPKLEKLEILPGRRVLMLPGAKQQVEVMARFSDGSVRNVTSLSKLSTSDEDVATVTREGLVEGLQKGEIAVVVRYQYILQAQRITFLQNVPGFVWNNPPEGNFIDRAVFDRLKLFQIPASDLAPDSEFIRRAYLDTLGFPPNTDEVRAFLKDTAADKRENLIDALTARPEFADLWALKWADVLRISDDTLKEQGAKLYHQWVRDSFAANKPVDQFVRELLTSSGSTLENAPANFYRALKEKDDQEEAAGLSQATSQLFLGVRITCAKCHNHPFERWTQDEYYQLAAFFSQVRHRGGGRRQEDETIELDPRGEVTHLRTGKVMAPKLLGAEFPRIEKGQDRRVVLAEWLTRKDNPFFAKSIVNRTWANIMGRGLVEPVDDFRESNPPVNDALLEGLAKDFAEHNFDFRYLVRTIMRSRTYQLTARTVPLNQDDSTYFSHALTRLLSAEQLSDAITRITGVPEQFPGYPMGTRAMQLAGTKARTPFLKTFGRPDRNLTCECEREKEPNLFQALALISGRNVDGRLRSPVGRVAQLAASQKPDAEILEELYLAAFSRLPTDKERREWLSYIGKATDRRQALEDLGWVLINSKEFLFRH